jgi:Lipopolysaccharide export system permease LptF/LptG
MNLPGDRLRRLAVRLFTARTMEHVIDPLLADLQTEYQEAVREGFVWKAHWVRLVGYAVFLKTVAWLGWAQTTGVGVDRAVNDRRALRLVIQLTVAMTMATTLFIAAPVLMAAIRLHVLSRTIWYAVPSTFYALPLTLPVGLMFGVLFGLRPYALSRRVTRRVLAMVCACAIASFVLSGWVLPLEHRGVFSVTFGAVYLPPRVRPDQLTLPELIHEVALHKQMGIDVRDATEGRPLIRRSPQFAAEYESRWALTLGTISLPFFALVMVARRREPVLLCVAGCVAVVAFSYVLGSANTAYTRSDTLPAFAVAWLPNLGVTALMLPVLALRRRVGGSLVAPSASVDGQL